MSSASDSSSSAAEAAVEATVEEATVKDWSFLGDFFGVPSAALLLGDGEEGGATIFLTLSEEGGATIFLTLSAFATFAFAPFLAMAFPRPLPAIANLGWETRSGNHNRWLRV